MVSSRLPISVIVTKYSWILPIIVELGDKPFTRDDLANRLNICKSFSKTIIWIMKKLNILQQIDDKYVIDSDIVKHVNSRFICKRDRRYVFQESCNIILVRVLKDRILTKKVNIELVNKVEELLRNSKYELSLGDISKMLKERPDRVAIVLRILETCNKLIVLRDFSGKRLYRISH